MYILFTGRKEYSLCDRLKYIDNLISPAYILQQLMAYILPGPPVKYICQNRFAMIMKSIYIFPELSRVIFMTQYYTIHSVFQSKKTLSNNYVKVYII